MTVQKNIIGYFRNRTGIAVLCSGAVLSAVGFGVIRQLDNQRFQTDFAASAERRVRAISRQIDGDLSALAALRAFIEVGHPLDASDFDRFAARILEFHPSLLALEWITRSRGPVSRQAVESELRRNYSVSAGITEGRPGEGQTAAQRDEYFPVRFLFPRNDANSPALGYDLGSCVPCLETLGRASATGQPATMGRVRTLERTRDRYAVPVVLPAFRSIASTDHVPTDYAMILLQIGAVVERALEPLEPGRIEIEFYDESAAPSDRFLYYHGAAAQPNGQGAPPTVRPNAAKWPAYTQSLSVGNRTWKLICTPTAAYFASSRTSWPWLVLLGGLLSTVVVAGLVQTKSDITELREHAAGVSEAKERLEDLATERGLQLRDSEARLLQALDAVSDGFWEWTIQTGENYYSLQWIRLLGYTPEEVPPRAEFFYSCLHPDDVEGTRQAIEDHTAGRTPNVEMEIRLRRKTGEYLLVNNRGRVVAWDDQGQPSRMAGTITDITQRRQAEDKLREDMLLSDFSATVGSCLTGSQSLQAALQGCCEAIVTSLGAASAGIWILNRETSMLELRACAGPQSRPANRGTAPLGALGVGMIAQERQPHVTNQLADDMWTGEETWASQQGIVSFAGFPLLVEGQPVGVVDVFARHPLSDASVQALGTASKGIALSIHRAEAQEALRESGERTRNILALALDAIITIDSQSRVTGWNAKAEAIFGWPESQARGRKLAELIIPPSRRYSHDQGLRRFLQSGEGRMVNRVVELTALRRDGTEFPVEMAILPHTIQGAQHFSAFIRDITGAGN